MTDFNPGMSAPDFKLGNFELSQELKKGPVLLTFYKKTCPTCQFTYPFLEKLHKHYTSKNFQVIGIGQDPETKEFSKQYGITFPMISDTADYAVSKQYHLTNVPTIFLITPDKKIQFIGVGFLKNEFLELSQKIASLTQKPTFDILKQGDNVPEFKAG